VSGHREEHLELCAAAALGSLDPIDRERLDQHLAGGCKECEAALADYSAATVMLAASSPPATPSPALRERVVGAVARSTAAAGPVTDGRGRVIEMPTRRSRPWLAWTFAAAAAALAAVSLIFWNDAMRLRAELETAQDEVSEIESQLREQERVNEVLSAPGTRVTEMERAPSAERPFRGRAYHDPATGDAVLLFENLDDSEEHFYTLWAMRGGSPDRLRVIEVDGMGRAEVRLENLGGPSAPEALTVSLEPEGGPTDRMAPTGPVVLTWTLGR
jgi:anti-sigma-K factor RskA